MASPTELLSQAIEKRHGLLSEDTNALRLFDGYGDGDGEVEIEAYGDAWIVQTRDINLSPAWREFFGQSGRTVYWKNLSQTQKESPKHLNGALYKAPYEVFENGLKFLIRFDSGYSQGIFLDQRLNRQEVMDRVQRDEKESPRVLNTFAYTGAFSVCAASVGAVTTTLDLSQPYLEWAKENFQANGMDPSDHYFCKGDTFHWLKRFAKQGRKFDGIILDPPTFSRTKEGKVFSVQKNYGALVALAEQCLEEGGWMLCCTNCRQLHEEDFMWSIRAEVDSARSVTARDMPPEYTGEDYLKSVWID